MMRWVRVSVLFVVVSCVAPAKASRLFPGEVKAALQMPCEPGCTICHLTDEGGYGTLKAGGFGMNLRDHHGLVAREPDTVAPAIESARQGKLDSDGDGRLDVDELAKGDDPNDRADDANVCGGPEYGCGSRRIARGDSLDGVATLFAVSALAVGAALFRRRTSTCR